MSYRYIPASAALTVWGMVLFVAGAALSGWMSASAVLELFLDATSVFYSSDADVYSGLAVLFACVSIAGFVLLAVGISRALRRVDQRYDGWFRALPPAPVQPGVQFSGPLPAASVSAPGPRGEHPKGEHPNAGVPPMPMHGPSQPGR